MCACVVSTAATILYYAACKVTLMHVHACYNQQRLPQGHLTQVHTYIMTRLYNDWPQHTYMHRVNPTFQFLFVISIFMYAASDSLSATGGITGGVVVFIVTAIGATVVVLVLLVFWNKRYSIIWIWNLPKAIVMNWEAVQPIMGCVVILVALALPPFKQRLSPCACNT